jgi:membrane-associated phospholipid phosphatase
MTTRPRLLHIGKRWLVLLVGRIGIAGIAAVVALFIFARFSAEFGEQGGGLPRFDQDVLNYLRIHRIQWLFQFAYGVSWLFRPWGQGAFVLLAATAFFLNRRRDAALTMIVGAVGGGFVVASLKTLFGRPRPEEIFAPLGYSFPSGHTFGAVTILGITGYYLARQVAPSRRAWVWGASIIGMFLVGWSRIYLGEHFPSDVGAGYAAAFCWVYVCLSVSTTFRNKATKAGESEEAIDASHE